MLLQFLAYASRLATMWQALLHARVKGGAPALAAPTFGAWLQAAWVQHPVLVAEALCPVHPALWQQRSQRRRQQC